MIGQDLEHDLGLGVATHGPEHGATCRRSGRPRDGTLASVDPTAPIDALRGLVGPDHVLTAPDRTASYSTDWTGRFVGSTPAVVRPSSAEEVAAVVRLCRETGTALVPQGGNTGLVGGSTPLGGEVVLSTERLVGVGDVDRDAGQLTAGAGVPLSEVQRVAADAGWRYGVDLAARDTATIGGTIATNAGGLRVLRFGSTRRQVLGVEAVLGTGEVISRLGGVVKDNTGYDLAGLLCGSEGTLGIVCRARLALVPPAGTTVTALVGFVSMDDAVRAVGHLRRSVPGLEAAEVVLAAGVRLVSEITGTAPVLAADTPVQIVVEAVGPPDPTASLGDALDRIDGVAEVAVATDAVRAERLWHVREFHTEAIARIGIPQKYDVTLPAHRLADFCTTVPALVAEVAGGVSTWLFGHLADGNIHVNVTGLPDGNEAALDRAVLEAVLARGGSISAEHGIGIAKRAWLGRDRLDGDVAAMRSVKAALDPAGICNPGALLDQA